MRSRTCGNLSRDEAHQWPFSWLVRAKLVEDHAWNCTASVVLNVVLRGNQAVSRLRRNLPDRPRRAVYGRARIRSSRPKRWHNEIDIPQSGLPKPRVLVVRLTA